MARSYKQGIFVPKNPQKYVGDVSNICYRSSWELKFMLKCDLDPSILRWCSEEMVVPYWSPVDQKMHRYFIDFVIEVKTRSGEIKRYAVEIKPEMQTVPPPQPKNKGKKTQLRYLNEVTTYAVNTAKWKAAEEYCKKSGMQFVIFTEKHLKV